MDDGIYELVFMTECGQGLVGEMYVCENVPHLILEWEYAEDGQSVKRGLVLDPAHLQKISEKQYNYTQPLPVPPPETS